MCVKFLFEENACDTTRTVIAFTDQVAKIVDITTNDTKKLSDEMISVDPLTLGINENMIVTSVDRL